ncbi:hypothetical protein K438DRAFT_1704178 [Mycena galopus ATCC 62051]|nr:hypothetical protein K438DRAFT_1998306 [Mycena galopus ATCC 62051]KAF8133095.1 hypothetical protein K438DRAFT_1884437 [Mycena galopus ATCC 62051]KAF8217046.1 hypothetical protein K438DRAFT_1704178 [Mycena galopus ATCC 62051]
MTTNSGEVSRRHPDFYYYDGQAILELTSSDCPEGILYNLHPGVLGERGSFFKSLFSLPRGPGCAPALLFEGTADENPIKLSYCVTRMDFDFLLTYLYMGPSVHPKSNEFFISVMRLSSFFEIQDGMEYAKAELERRGNCIHPAVQFELARSFRIDEWIEPAFRRLLDMPIVQLSSTHALQIGHFGYFWLTQTKAKMIELRTHLAFNVPPVVNSARCKTKVTCGLSWSEEWRGNVRNLIHHPDKPIRCLDLLHQLRNVHITGLCDDCQDLTVTWLWGKPFMTKEWELIEEAIAALQALQVNEPVRVVVNNNTRVVLPSDL